MKRHLESKLDHWKKQPSRKPLVLKGLRQCGKTFLLTTWGKKNFPNCHYINFEESPLAARIFEGDLSPKNVLRQLSFFLDSSINEESDLVIFDEIQACPRALTSLKYFNEQMPGLALASAGSLLGLSLNDGSFPVGKVEILSFFPMSFLEFLLALGDLKSVDAIRECTQQTDIPEVVHQHLWERLKWYFVTGGLPEVVATFREHQDDLNSAFKKVREKQKQLLFAYYADFAKHSGKENALHIDRVWRAVPQQLALSQNASASRFQFTGVVPGIDRYQRLAGAIEWLNSTGLILKTSITSHAEIPLLAFCKEAIFKLYCCDVGLLGAMIDLPPKAIMHYDYGSYKGYFAENFVAQELTCRSDEALVCWQQARAEIEFLRTVDTAIIPLEVKSGTVLRAKSVEKFAQLYQPPYSVILSGKTIHVDDEKKRHNYPLYLACQFPLRTKGERRR